MTSFEIRSKIYPSDTIEVGPRKTNSGVGIISSEGNGKNAVGIYLTEQEALDLATAIEFYAKGLHRNG